MAKPRAETPPPSPAAPAVWERVWPESRHDHMGVNYNRRAPRVPEQRFRRAVCSPPSPRTQQDCTGVARSPGRRLRSREALLRHPVSRWSQPHLFTAGSPSCPTPTRGGTRGLALGGRLAGQRPCAVLLWRADRAALRSATVHQSLAQLLTHFAAVTVCCISTSLHSQQQRAMDAGTTRTGCHLHRGARPALWVT